MELPTITGLAQGVISAFFLAMRNILQKKQGLVKEDLHCLGLDNVMLLRTLPGVSVIPVNARNMRQFKRGRIFSSYTSVAGSDNQQLLFLSEQGKLSRRLLTQPLRQSSLAPEQGR